MEINYLFSEDVVWIGVIGAKYIKEAILIVQKKSWIMVGNGEGKTCDTGCICKIILNLHGDKLLREMCPICYEQVLMLL